MRKLVRSSLQQELALYVKHERQLGYKFDTQFVILKRFMKCVGDDYKELGITKSAFDSWSINSKEWSAQYQHHRLSVVLRFSRFLINKGIDSFIGSLPKYPTRNFIPKIFTEQEITQLFSASDNHVDCRSRKSSASACFPTLLRLLYSTGIRVGEALNLQLTDLDLEQQLLRVIDNKNGRERQLPIPTSLSNVLHEYLTRRNLIVEARLNNFLFVTLCGQPCGRSSIDYLFQCALKKAGLRDVGTIRSFRIHDIRHTCAVHLLQHFVQENVDISILLPKISAFLGHTSIYSTEQYLRLVRPMYSHLISDNNNLNFNIIPKQNYDEKCTTY